MVPSREASGEALCNRPYGTDGANNSLFSRVKKELSVISGGVLARVRVAGGPSPVSSIDIAAQALD